MLLDVPLEELEQLSVRAMMAMQDLGVATLRELNDVPPTALHPRVLAELRALFDEAGEPLPAQLTERPVKAMPPRGEPAIATGSLRERWTTIESWLRIHDAKRLAGFRAPASADAIAALERTLAVTLPSDYRDFLLIHDGQDEASSFVRAGVSFPLAPLARIDEAYRSLSAQPDHDRSLGASASIAREVKDCTFSRGWIPIGVSARGRDFLCLDLDPSQGGNVGQVIEVVLDDAVRHLVAPSFVDLVSKFFAQVQAGELDDEDG